MMPVLFVLVFLFYLQLGDVLAFRLLYPHQAKRSESCMWRPIFTPGLQNPRGLQSVVHASVETCPYDDIIPFLSEHINPSDQLLFVGAKTDLSLQLVKKGGYGTKMTGFMLVVDQDAEALEALKSQAAADPDLEQFFQNNKLRFQVADLTSMPEVCKQSTVDAIVDYGGLDSVLNGPSGKEGMLRCIDELQNAVRLGNILVCLSKLEKEVFCGPFEERFGWVQELDGDPGEISAWYRGKTNIQATKSNFKKHGLKMFVYTNVDNC